MDKILSVGLLIFILVSKETLAQEPKIPQNVLNLVREIKMLKAQLRGVTLTKDNLSGYLDGDEIFLNIPALQLTKNTYMAELVQRYSAGRKKRSTADEHEIQERQKRGIMDFSNPFLLTGKWQDGLINYALNQTLTATQKKVVTDALKWWTDKTCIQFREVFQANRPTEPYVIFTQGASCVSFVGRTVENIPQPTYLDANCFQLVGRVAHEIGHTLGLWHTHQLSTRNDYVVIFPNNMAVQNDGEIVDLPASIINYYSLPYDYASIMHYDPRVFALAGRTTIETRDPLYQQTIGQRSEISFQDAKLINLEYCVSRCRNIRINCQNGGYQDHSNCGRCFCPDGWTGPLCTNVDTTRCGGDIIVDGRGGSISTPGFDQGRLYQDNIMCAWRLRNTFFQNMVFEFDNRFGIYCFGDTAFHWVELRINGTLYDTGYRFCGTQKPQKVFVSVSPSHEVMVVFKSPYNAPSDFRRDGFKLSYRLENQVGCMAAGCENGGTCNLATGMCTCTQEFKGIKCEVDDRCNQGYCQNGATCTTRPRTVPLCSCRPGFNGPRCQTADPTQAPPRQGDCGACGLKGGEHQIACNSTTETEQYEVRCQSLDSRRFFLSGGWERTPRLQTWCTVELPKKYCCANAELMRVNDDFLCAVPGWSDWTPCAGRNCGGCGVRRRTEYQIIRRFRSNCYSDSLISCGEDRQGCNFNPCPLDQCNGNTQTRDDGSSSEEHGGGWFWGKRRRRRRRRGVLDFFFGGGRGGHDGNGGQQNDNECINRCCQPYRLSSDGSTCSDGSTNSNPSPNLPPQVDPANRNPVTPSTTQRNIEPLILEPTTQPDNVVNWGQNPRTPTTLPPEYQNRRPTTTLPPWMFNP